VTGRLAKKNPLQGSFFVGFAPEQSPLVRPSGDLFADIGKPNTVLFSLRSYSKQQLRWLLRTV